MAGAFSRVRPTASKIRHRRTIEALKHGLPQPWDLIAGWGGLLPICRGENVLERTVLLPYGVIEGEPSYPATNLNLDNIRPQFREFAAKYPTMAGMMGNVQTPLLQFPHVYYFTSAMFDAAYRDRPEKDVLLDLCGRLYPEHKQLLADCYMALRSRTRRRSNRWSTGSIARFVKTNSVGSASSAASCFPITASWPRCSVCN